MARPSFPKRLRQFQADFATEEACQEDLTACRWPDGFVCPRCGHARAYELVSQRCRQCVKCRHQVSLTSGAILHRTKIPLVHWFCATYLMTTDKRGVSALLLQRQLGLSRYETAWMMLLKLRRAMGNVAREPLRGEVEVDDTWVGGEPAGLRGSRQRTDRRAALVLVTVEKAWQSFRSSSHECDPRFQGQYRSFRSSPGTSHPVPPAIRTASRVSTVSRRRAFNIQPAYSRFVRNCETAQNRWSCLPIERLATCNSGSSAPITV